MLDNDPPPPPPCQVINDPISSTHHHQQNQQGNGNNLFDPPPFNNDNALAPLPFDQGDLPPFFSPLPTFADTFVFNTPLEDHELNPSYQYQYPSDNFWHGFETYDDLFTTPLFQHFYAPIHQSFETTPPIVFPPPPPQPQSLIASYGGGESSEPNSVPIINVDDAHSPSITEASVVKAMMVIAPPWPSPPLPPIVSNDGGEASQPNSFPVINVDALSSSVTKASVVEAIIAPPLLLLPPPPPIASYSDGEPSYQQNSVSINNVDNAPSSSITEPRGDEAIMVIAPPSPLLPSPHPIVSIVGSGNASYQKKSVPIIDVDALSPSITETSVVEAMMVTEPPSLSAPPLPTIVSIGGGEPIQPNSVPIIIDVDTPFPITGSSADEAMIIIAPSSPPPPPPPTMTQNSDEPNLVPMLIANSSSSSSPSSPPPSMDVSDVQAMFDALLSSHATTSNSHPPFMATPLFVDQNQSSKATKRNNNQHVDSYGDEDCARHHSRDTGIRLGVPIISELDFLQRFLSLGTKGDSLHTMIIKVQKEQDAMDIITSIAKEKGSLLILGTFGTLSVAQFMEQGMPTSCEGNFIIISLAGIIVFDGDTQTMNQVSVSIAGIGGKVFGGPVNGRLVASTPLQMIGFTLIRKDPINPRRLKTKLSIPKIQKVKNEGGGQIKEKKVESEEEANRSQVSIIKELNENITKSEEGSKFIDEMLAELYTDAELILAPDEIGDVQMVDVIHDQVH